MSTPAVVPDFIPAQPSGSPDFIPYTPSAGGQPAGQQSAQSPERPWLMDHPYLSALWGAAKQAGSAVFGAGGPQAGFGPEEAPGTQPKPMLQSLRDAWSNASVKNILPNSMPDIKALNPIAPALNNPNTAEGLGQSAVNLLLLRQVLSGRTPYFRGVAAAAPEAEAVGPLNRQAASTDDLIQQIRDAMDKKYGPQQWGGEPEQAPVIPDTLKLLRRSIAAAKSRK